MPTPLTPSPLQEIIPISPPPASSSSAPVVFGKLNIPRKNPVHDPTSSSRKLPRLYRDPNAKKPWSKDDKGKGKGKEKEKPGFFDKVDRKGKGKEGGEGEGESRGEKRGADGSEEEPALKSRARTTEQMMRTLGKGNNPITNSDMPSRTDHVVSCATGHQRNDQRGAGQTWTYAKVRDAQMEKQSRESKTALFKGCLFYFNGSTGEKVSNIQLRNMITTNGGRFTTIQGSSCTHVIANNGLSGRKAQKVIDAQGARARQTKVVRVEWVLDCVERGVKLSEAGYGVIEDPTQPNLFKTLGVKPKASLNEE
ncbi:hypothetical protein IAT38_000633 [Cryptococcus sp. DSM 104549]